MLPKQRVVLPLSDDALPLDQQGSVVDNSRRRKRGRIDLLVHLTFGEEMLRAQKLGMGMLRFQKLGVSRKTR